MKFVRINKWIESREIKGKILGNERNMMNSTEKMKN